MKVSIHSNKYGKHSFLIDEIDFNSLIGYTFYLWSTPRHSGIYVNCYSPENRKTPKRLHRVVLGAKNGEIVDHINGNPLDNRRCNLRIASSGQNNKNARKRKNCTSTFKGVCKTKEGSWKAQIQYEGKKVSLGTFKTELEAAAAYDVAAKTHHGDFAVLNNP